MEELWKPIKNYEGIYEISNYGRVKSLEREKLGKFREYIVPLKEMILTPSLTPKGYPFVHLSNDGKSETIVVHMLVWDAFGNKPRDGMRLLVDHRDENKLNNHISNLQLLSNRENIKKSHASKKSLPVGISYDRSRRKYRARIWDKGKDKQIGYFECPVVALNEYEKIEQLIYPKQLQEMEQ